MIRGVFCWLSRCSPCPTSPRNRPRGQADPASRPVHTFSIVARDPQTGDLGVAVQSHWFSVGTLVPWAEAGVGAVATQSFVDPVYGRIGLEMMRAGKGAPEALKGLLAGDEGRDVRQVAMIDARGRVDAWTGKGNIQAAGHIVGKGFSVQANLMLNDQVWPAMAKAFESARGDLADRMLAALDAAQAAGGDIRGRQSAAMIVVTASPPDSHGRIASSTCASTTAPSRSRSCAGCWRCSAPTIT